MSTRPLRRMAALLTLSALLFSLTACSAVTIYTRYRELSDLELVQVIGIDADGDGSRVTVSMSSDPEGAPDVVSRAAADLPAALSLLADNPALRQPYYSHTEQILLGESEAARGVAACLDTVIRSAEMRSATPLFIVRGEAGAMIGATNGDERRTNSMLRYLGTYAPQMGAGHVTTCASAAAALAGRGCALILAVRLAGEVGEDGAETDSPVRIEPAGYALLKDGRLAGYIEAEAARGALLLSGQFRSCMAEVTDPEGRRAVAELTGVTVQYEPHFDSTGALTGFSVGAAFDADITSLDPGCRPDEEAWRAAVERRLAQQTADWIRSALARLQELGADGTDIEGRLRMAAPVRMDRALRLAGTEGFGSLLPSLAAEVAASVTLRRSYDLDAPLAVDGADGGEESPILTEKEDGANADR